MTGIGSLSLNEKKAVPHIRLPPGKAVPYIIPAYEGEAITIPGTKSTFRILASAAETDGTISVFGMDGAVADPPGFHYHNQAHDVFMCTKGRLKIWAGDKCKILYPGDFAYVPPGIVHQPQVLDKGVNETMGLVTPGQWVDFFRFVSETYEGVIADEFDARNPGAVFGPKIREIKEKYDVVFQPQFKGAEANTGPVHVLEGIISRPFITTKQSTGPTGNFAITSIESSNRHSNTILSKPFTFEKVHQVFHVIDGAISLTVNGGEDSLVRGGETVFLPARTAVTIKFVDRYVRFWSYSSGDGLETLIKEAGEVFEGTIVPDPHQCSKLDVERLKKVAAAVNVKLTV